MMLHALYIFLLLHIFPTTPTTAAVLDAYSPNDVIRLSCGESEIVNDTYNNRLWVGDEGVRFMPSNAAAISSASTASYMQESVFPVPYKTARVIHKPFTYTFPLSTGQKFLRLYFYPNVYSGFNTSQSRFSVTANAFILLSNFSANLYSKDASQFMNEFVIRVGEDEGQLNLTFSPNPNSFAFVNGIEIVSIPDALYFGRVDVPVELVGQFTQFLYLNNNTALENLYRLNVGGYIIGIQEDSPLFRSWPEDSEYIYGGDFSDSSNLLANVVINYTVKTPLYTAPPPLYATARVSKNSSISLEWRFPVDSGFYYAVRLHFCEIMQEVTAKNKRLFAISINNRKVEEEADVLSWTGGHGIPIFKDYIISLPDVGRRLKQDLRLSLTPTAAGKSEHLGALLNGLEVFRLNDPNNMFEAGNYESTTASPTFMEESKPSKKSERYTTVFAGIGGGIRGLMFVVAVCFLVYDWVHQPKTVTDANSSWETLSTTSASTTIPTGLGHHAFHSDSCRYFSLDEIRSATRNFDDSCIIGQGGFGNVYKGIVEGAAATVAIKRLHSSSNQGAREFLTEIELLSKLRHPHLMSLIGYCNDKMEMILVYEYMAHGTLRDHLFNLDINNPLLPWNRRLQICLGAAKGLHHLHNGADQAIIHRDVKSSNILLDDTWQAKISDFGLSKMGRGNDSFTHISTTVKGTFGYLDPKYFLTNQLTRKSDVYAFGVVLFEVLSGRAAVDMKLDEEQHSLAEWARHCMRLGEVDRLIDSNLKGKISAACFKVYVGTAGRCIHVQPLERPTMADVVMGLELALSLQQTTDSAKDDGDAGRIYSDRSDSFISMDDITAAKEESDSLTG